MQEHHQWRNDVDQHFTKKAEHRRVDNQWNEEPFGECADDAYAQLKQRKTRMALLSKK